jgi:hypothetical protein
MTIGIRSLTLPSSLPLLILITNHERLPEAVNVEFSNYLAYRPKSAHFATTSGSPPSRNTLVSAGVAESESTNRSGV